MSAGPSLGRARARSWRWAGSSEADRLERPEQDALDLMIEGLLDQAIDEDHDEADEDRARHMFEPAHRHGRINRER